MIQPRLPRPAPSILLLGLALPGCGTTDTKEFGLEELQDLVRDAEDRTGQEFGEEEFRELAAKYADTQAETVEGLTSQVDEELESIPINPYLEFGEQIIAYPDGRIMKPYPFPTGAGQKTYDLLVQYSGLTIFMPEEGLEQPSGTVQFDFRADFITEAWSEPRSQALEPGVPIALGDMLFVTAEPEILRDVENFINLFAADVRQIEIEAKIVEVTTTDSLDIGVRPISTDPATPIFGLPDNTLVRSIDFAFPNTADSAEALFTLSSVNDGLIFNAVLEAVANYENVSIISRPKVAVREGARAEIVNTTQIPFFDITGLNDNGSYSAGVSYKDVGVQMYVIPRVIGTETVVLNIDIEASQETGTAVTFRSGEGVNATEISNPVLALRKARTIVRLEPGQAVVLGGLISERVVDRESKIPFVGDIPLLGALFRSTFKRKEQTNVLFFIRPRILQGSDLNRPFE